MVQPESIVMTRSLCTLWRRFLVALLLALRGTTSQCVESLPVSGTSVAGHRRDRGHRRLSRCQDRCPHRGLAVAVSAARDGHPVLLVLLLDLAVDAVVSFLLALFVLRGEKYVLDGLRGKT